MIGTTNLPAPARCAAVCLLFMLAAHEAEWPQTRAESTAYRETSRYADVTAFLERLQEGGAPIRVEYIGETAQGRRMPLVVASRPPVASAVEARRLGKAVVYVQANIHGGEVEGKEAVLMLLREIASGRSAGLLERLVVLAAPIYNIDGNERWGDGRRNRPSQDGPETVGERANGQGLDLNRDCMKAESPEMRAVLEAVYRAWDPEVVLDLHTTNGTRHGYALTYAPPLNPNTEAGIAAYARERLLPVVRSKMRSEHSTEVFDYGNVSGSGDSRAWVTFGEEPRYVTNYAGLRNRVAILSEAASYLPFETRVRETLNFVRTVLEQVALDSEQVRRAARAADAAVVRWGTDPLEAPKLGVRFEADSRGVEEVLLERPLPPGRARESMAPWEIGPVRLPVFDRFRPVRHARFPAAYALPASAASAAELLLRHGITVERLLQPWNGPAERFRILEAHRAQNTFQGHRLIRLEGRFEPGEAELESGCYVVPTSQPLGILAFHLLEPESLDGVAAWGFLGEGFEAGSDYPVVKLPSAPNAASERIRRP